MMISRRFLQFASLICATAVVQAQYVATSGRPAIYQQSLDAQARMTVLSIALRPGDEDLATLAYFRLGKGAQVLSAFVTNGEGGSSDLRGEYPAELAGVRREEAAKAAALVGGGAFFLNMPDVVAAHDTAFVHSKWQRDTLYTRLVKLISDFHADVVIVARDWLGGASSPQVQVLRDELIRALRHLDALRPSSSAKPTQPSGPWSVSLVVIDRGTNGGSQVPTDKVHPIWKKSYRDIGEEAAGNYASMAVQRRLRNAWSSGTNSGLHVSTYEALDPKGVKPPKRFDQDLPKPVPQRLSGIMREVAVVTAAAMRGQTTIPVPGGKPQRLVVRAAAVIDSVDRVLSRIYLLSPVERKITLQWKLALEELRACLLGVEVRYTLSPRLLTERQVTLFEIDTITGIRRGGSTSLYFSGSERGWIINESNLTRLPVEFHKPYRLVTPEHLSYDLPAGGPGLERMTVGTSLLFYIIHEAPKREESFMTKVVVPLQFSPRFTVEPLTPIVRAMPSERLPLRLTNHSRDGVADSIYASDSLVNSGKRFFRLNNKDEAHLDTLALVWPRPLEEGSYVLPVKISDRVVARFAARKFDVQTDVSKRVALVSGLPNSPTEDALRRIGTSWSLLRPGPRLADDLAKFQVVIIDRRALSLDESLPNYREVFERYVQQGGHLIVMAQDAGVWNSHPLIDGLKLTASFAFDPSTAVQGDSSHRLWSYPNIIRRGDWRNWDFELAYNTLSGPAVAQADSPVKSAADGKPLTLMWKRGSGTLTYVDLALQNQFLNLLPGAFRLLANLISY